MSNRHYKNGNVIHQEGRYQDDEDDVFFDQLGKTRRYVVDEWDSNTTSEALMWNYFSGYLLPTDLNVYDRDKEIMSMYNSGVALRTIAERVGLKTARVRRIIKRELSCG